ncbi:MAG: DUF4230 domain-containing protein [Fimbriimonas sp.]
MRNIGLIAGAAVLLGVGFWVGGLRAPKDPIARETIPMPMLLKQVQALGELHTASYSYENVFEHRSQLNPQGMLASFPGASSIARAATGNRALVSADGTVEAGVDLAKAKIEANRIVLPRARMYEPQVHAKLHQVRRGLFWRDENLALEAVSDAKERMAGAAREGGILADAERNAVTQVKKLVPPTVAVSVEGL